MLKQSPYKEDANLKTTKHFKSKRWSDYHRSFLILVMIIIQKPSTQKTLKKIITTLKKINLTCLMIIL